MSLSAQPAIQYTMDFREPNSHLIDITMTIRNALPGTQQVALPAWRPGRYAIQNYSRLVQEVRAASETGLPLPIRKLNKDTWEISNGNVSAITVTYSFYATILDAGSTFYNDQEIYFNGSNLFMYVPGRLNEPVFLKINHPDGWQTATALKPAGPKSFTAASFHELADSPTIISPTLQHRKVTVDSINFHIWIQGETNGNPDALAEGIRKMARTHLDFWQGVVPFTDFHFLYHLVDYRSGHGVEHAKSTSMVLGPLTNLPDPDDWKRAYPTTSHELFHAWHVKYLVPADLEPYDYSKEQYTNLIWFLEGFTSYFDIYLNHKAGLITEAEYWEEFERLIRQSELNPGTAVTSIADASYDAWLYGYSSDGNKNRMVTFYSQGELFALLLDLDIRKETNHQKTLGDLMRWLVAEFPVKGRFYQESDLLNGLKLLTGKSYAPWFADYVHGTKPFPFQQAFDSAGYELIKVPADPVSRTLLGADFKRVDEDWVVDQVLPDSPAMKAGLFLGDKLSGSVFHPLPDKNLDAWLAGNLSDSTLTLEVKRRGKPVKLVLSGLNTTHYTYKIQKKTNHTSPW